VSGALEERLWGGLLVIAATVLAGIAVMRAWLEVFGGPTLPDGPRHAILARERVGFVALLAVLLGFGLWPAPLVAALDRAAARLLAPVGPASSPVSSSEKARLP